MLIGSALIVSALSLGMGSSLHCVGMCGPLIMALPFNPDNRIQAIFQFLLYTLSKASMYGIIGLLPGWMGWNMQQIVGPGWISFIVGCLVLIIALSPSLKLISLFPNSFVNHIRNMYQQMYHQPIWYYFIVGGIFNALLPCTMIFLALTASIVTASPLSGFLFMFYFGMGTMPALAAVHMSKAWYLQRFRSRAQSTSRIITLVLGVVLILRSLLPHHNHALSSTNKATSICKSISL